MPRAKFEGTCSVEGCEDSLKARGWCKYHYQKYYKSHEDYKEITGENLRFHPLYIIWWQRKENGFLCDKWQKDFSVFVKDISPKPEGNYLLVRIKEGPFSPDNFKWQEHLKRKDWENKKDWFARKWAARQLQNPSMGSDRNIKRKYNLTRSQYDEKLKLQNFVCAICEEKETSVDGRTGSIKNLAVDHCHKTNKIRDLLCWRCNGTIGKMDENLDLFERMINYLKKHKEQD